MYYKCSSSRSQRSRSQCEETKAKLCLNYHNYYYWISASGQIQDGGRPTNFKPLNRYNSAADCSISLKFGMCVRYGSAEVKRGLKSTYRKIQRGDPPSNLQIAITQPWITWHPMYYTSSWSRNQRLKSQRDVTTQIVCSLKFCTEFDHIPADALQTFKVKRLKVKVAA